MTIRTADIIREKLEQMIFTGEFQDGERLDETKLAERFEVSRTPLREAFQMLAASGLLKLIPRRGAFIRHPNLVELVEMFEVMAEFEVMCGVRAARRITDDHFAQIMETLAGCEEALAKGETDEYYRINERFHHLIYQASGNNFMAEQASALHKRLKPFRRTQLQVRGRMLQSMTEHYEIVKAIETGDADQTASVLRKHIAIQGEKFSDFMAGYKFTNSTVA